MTQHHTDRAPRFPYMVWAHRDAARTDCSLSFSGMPAPDSALFAGARLADLDHADREAQPLLRQRLARRLGVAEERVLLCLGASGGMHLAAQRWFRPGARVLCETPSYEPVRALPRHFGATCLRLERRFEDRWRLDSDVAARLLPPIEAAPGHIFITNPNNPTGARARPEELQALGRVAEAAGGVLVSCEVYMEFAALDSAHWAHALCPNGLSIASFTKAWGLGALRLGWVVLGEGLVAERERLLDELYLTYVDPPTPVLRAGLHALERLETLRPRIERFERECKPLLVDWLGRTRWVRGLPPDLGLTAFAQVLDARGKPRGESFELVRRLQQQHGVDVVPGEYWDAPGWLRIGYGVEPERLALGLERLEQGLAALA